MCMCVRVRYRNAEDGQTLAHRCMLPICRLQGKPRLHIRVRVFLCVRVRLESLPRCRSPKLLVGEDGWVVREMRRVRGAPAPPLLRPQRFASRRLDTGIELRTAVCVLQCKVQCCAMCCSVLQLVSKNTVCFCVV